MPSVVPVGQQPSATVDAPSAPDALAPAAATSAQGRPLRGHLAGLDGLRALAIIAVVVFHLVPAWLPGGFLGVDVFFVISCFLITTLLVRERRSTGGVDLRGFWTRRARRVQKPRRSTPPVERRSRTSRVVMRKQEMTKKTSTPRKPPGSHAGTRWKTTTAMIARARRPSRPARWPRRGRPCADVAAAGASASGADGASTVAEGC